MCMHDSVEAACGACTMAKQFTLRAFVSQQECSSSFPLALERSRLYLHLEHKNSISVENDIRALFSEHVTFVYRSCIMFFI